MNKGFVVGKVFTSYGKPKSGAEVILQRIDRDNGQLDVRKKSSSSTNTKGQFSIPFEWSGTDIGHAAAPISIVLSAEVEHKLSVNSMAWTIGRATTMGMLMRDIHSLMLVPLNDVLEAVKNSDVPGILDFIQDFIAGYRRFAAYPFWKTGQLSSESWLILGGVNIFLNESPYIGS